MATLYVNMKSGKRSPTADARQAMTTTTAKAQSTIVTDKVSEVSLYSDAAHLVHIAPAARADADSEFAFYLFPGEPCYVTVGRDCVISAKTLA